MPSSKKVSPRGRTGGRTRLDVEERRSQLVALALELFGKRPYDEVAIDDIAAAAGMSKGLLYHYFPTKRDFYVAGLREASRRLLLATSRAPSDGSPLERIRAGLDAYLDYVEAHAPAYVALLRGGIGADGEVVDILESTRRACASRILEGLPEEPSSPLLRAAVRGWVGMVEAASLDFIERRDTRRDDVRDLLADVLVSAIDRALSITTASSSARRRGR